MMIGLLLAVGYLLTFSKYQDTDRRTSGQEGTTTFDGYEEVTFMKMRIETPKTVCKKSEGFARCPIRNVLDRFGDKWSILVLLTLGENGTMRFNALHATIGDVSQKMLTVTLRTLEADGLVSRKIYPEVPPRVEYAITPLGASLMPHIHGLVQWAAQNMGAVVKARGRYAA
jgi:DNA-binding HxlR family transcriptional regulator